MAYYFNSPYITTGRFGSDPVAAALQPGLFGDLEDLMMLAGGLQAHPRLISHPAPVKQIEGHQTHHVHPLTRVPHFQVIDTEKDVLIHSEMCGFPRENLNVSIHNNKLTITGKEQSVGEDVPEALRHKKFKGFMQNWMVPVDLDADQLSANFQDGSLMVRIPKKLVDVPTGEARHVHLA